MRSLSYRAPCDLRAFNHLLKTFVSTVCNSREDSVRCGCSVYFAGLLLYTWIQVKLYCNSNYLFFHFWWFLRFGHVCIKLRCSQYSQILKSWLQTSFDHFYNVFFSFSFLFLSHKPNSFCYVFSYEYFQLFHLDMYQIYLQM